MDFTETNIDTHTEDSTPQQSTETLADLEEWHFGDNKQTADNLFELVKSGIKTATSYLYDEQDFVDTPSRYSILTNWDKTQKILLYTTKRSVVQFKDISAEHAFKEGEGNKTLKNWISIHKAFFTSRLTAQGKVFSECIKIVCEEFVVVKFLN